MELGELLKNIQDINNNSEYRDGDSKISDYIITKVELIISGPSTDNALNSSTYISATKVLKDIEKSYDKGKIFWRKAAKSLKIIGLLKSDFWIMRIPPQ